MNADKAKDLLKRTATVFNELGEKNDFLKQFSLGEYTMSKQVWNGTQLYNIKKETEEVAQFAIDPKKKFVSGIVKSEPGLEEFKKFLEVNEVAIALKNKQEPQQDSPTLQTASKPKVR